MFDRIRNFMSSPMMAVVLGFAVGFAYRWILPLVRPIDHGFFTFQVALCVTAFVCQMLPKRSSWWKEGVHAALFFALPGAMILVGIVTSLYADGFSFDPFRAAVPIMHYMLLPLGIASFFALLLRVDVTRNFLFRYTPTGTRAGDSRILADSIAHMREEGDDNGEHEPLALVQ